MFQDITTLLLDAKAFKDTVDLFVERYKSKNISVVAGEFWFSTLKLHVFTSNFCLLFLFVIKVYEKRIPSMTTYIPSSLCLHIVCKGTTIRSVMMICKIPKWEKDNFLCHGVIWIMVGRVFYFVKKNKRILEKLV